MRSESRAPEPSPKDDSQDAVDLGAFGFGFDDPDDDWLGQLREAEAPQTLGSIGSYELIEEVSRGGQGVVFRARQPGTKRDIAIKRLLAGSFSSSSTRLRFQREVEAAAALNHPNIVTVYGMEVVEGLPLLAMEWVEGEPVTTWAWGADRRGEELDPLPTRDPRESLEVFLRICDAVQHAHSRGVLHRDLKPSNILVTDSGQPHVLDFGLAKRLSGPDVDGPDADGADAEAKEDQLTRSSDFLGTPAYASPEQLRSEQQLDLRTDVYSLGVLLFEMLTGGSPYGKKGSASELIKAVETLEPPRLSAIDLRLGRELDTIVCKAMAKDSAERYTTVDAFAEDIRRYLRGDPILALEPGSLYLLRKLIQRNKLATAFAATVMVLMSAFGIYAMWQARLLKNQRDDAFTARTLAYEKAREAGENARLANEAADRLKVLLLQVADGKIGSQATRLGLLTEWLMVEPEPCPQELPSSKNPYFDQPANEPQETSSENGLSADGT